MINCLEDVDVDVLEDVDGNGLEDVDNVDNVVGVRCNFTCVVVVVVSVKHVSRSISFVRSSFVASCWNLLLRLQKRIRQKHRPHRSDNAETPT